MANIIFGKVWSLDTTVAYTSAGIVTDNPVNINSIIVRFTTAGAGSCIMTTSSLSSDNTYNDVILDLKTTASTSATVYQLDSRWTFGDQYFQGLRKKVCVNVDTIYVITGNPF